MSRKKRGFGGEILRALDLAAEPVAFEFGEDLVQTGAGEIHLVQRLHGGKPCRAALVGFARVLVAGGRARCHYMPASVRLSSTIDSAARAAAAPLLRLSSLARAVACACVSTVRMPLPIAIC